jgi:hypothetical protein
LDLVSRRQAQAEQAIGFRDIPKAAIAGKESVILYPTVDFFVALI